MSETSLAREYLTVARTDPLAIVISGFELRQNSVVPVGHPTFADWENAVNWTRFAKVQCDWWLGELLNYGEQHWGEKYTQVLNATDYASGTLRNVAYVTKAIPLSRRHDTLSFAHHAEVASLPPADQQALLDQAAEEEWPVKRLRKEAQKRKGYSFGPTLKESLAALVEAWRTRAQDLADDDPRGAEVYRYTARELEETLLRFDLPD